MDTVDVAEAQHRLDELLVQAAAGRDVVISRGGKPVARLTRLASVGPTRIRFGVLRGRVRVSSDFDVPLTDSEFGGLETGI